MKNLTLAGSYFSAHEDKEYWHALLPFKDWDTIFSENSEDFEFAAKIKYHTALPRCNLEFWDNNDWKNFTISGMRNLKWLFRRATYYRGNPISNEVTDANYLEVLNVLSTRRFN
jgi:hypothetical protein